MHGHDASDRTQGTAAHAARACRNFNGFSCADVKTFYVGSPQDADPENLNVRR